MCQNEERLDYFLVLLLPPLAAIADVCLAIFITSKLDGVFVFIETFLVLLLLVLPPPTAAGNGLSLDHTS
jgi:hypothetical protein